MRALVMTAATLTLAACASPRADLPALTEEALSDRRVDVQKEALSAALAREDRVQRLAWPILEANAELCTKTDDRFGFVVGNAETVTEIAAGLTRKQVETLGWDETPRILTVAPGAPADVAGLRQGDIIRGVNGQATEDVGAFVDAFDEAKGASEKKDVTLEVRRGEELLTLAVVPTEVCDVAVASSASNSINAVAGRRGIRIYAGLLRAFEDDRDVSFIISHELAHLAARHPRKVIRNAAVTGAGLWAPAMMVPAQIIDFIIKVPANRLGSQTPPASTAVERLAANAVRSADFEIEADVVGLYMLARSGQSPAALSEVFQTFTNVSPRSSWLRVTHPTTPERQLALEAAIADIERRQEAGEPLIPPGWED